MPQRGVKQPNGLYAIFSTVVDDFIAMRLTLGEMVEHFSCDMEHLEALDKARRAVIDEAFDSQRPNLTRWEDALADIEMRHGVEKRREREAQAMGGER
jgi:hypothetical protein